MPRSPAQNWHVTVGEGSNGHTYQVGPVIAETSDEAWKAGQRKLKPGQWMISVTSVGPVTSTLPNPVQS